MSLWMIGQGGWQPPFNRTFFNVTLGEILKRAGREKPSRLTLYLIDGTQLDVLAIEDLSDQHMIVRGGIRDEDAGDPSFHLLPYASIYRIEVGRSPEAEGRWLGFRWTPMISKARPGRKPQPRSFSSPVGGAEEQAEGPDG